MARIRSIHPSLCTDEIYMGLSLAAKAAWPLLWMECDDQGVFEWKPIVLKARLFPADSLDMGAVLDELAGVGAIKKVEIAGAPCGLVRNFCRYQRPKKPVYRFQLTDEWRTFVASSWDGTVPVPHQSRTGPVKSPQREEEGGSKEKVSKEVRASSPSSLRSEGSDGGPPAAEEPLTEPPFDLEDLPPKVPIRIYPPAPIPADTAQPINQAAMLKPQLYAWAKNKIGPKGGMIATKLLKQIGEDWTNIHHIIELADKAADPAAYLLGVIAKEQKKLKQAEVDDKELEAWKPKGPDYPQSDERGFYIKSSVDNSRRLYLDPDKVQRLVLAERDRRGVW